MKQKITISLHEGIVHYLDQEFGHVESKTSKQILWVLHKWLEEVIERNNRQPLNEEG